MNKEMMKIAIKLKKKNDFGGDEARAERKSFLKRLRY